MKLKCTVLQSSLEMRDLVGKDGVKQTNQIAHIVGHNEEGVYNIRCYNPTFVLPQPGKPFECVVRKYECFGGGVADVLI